MILQPSSSRRKIVVTRTVLTTTINHDNTISAGYEKDMVVGALLALHDAGIPMDGAGPISPRQVGAVLTGIWLMIAGQELRWLRDASSRSAQYGPGGGGP